MRENKGNSKWVPDYEHRIITVRPDLERKLNRKANELKRLDGAKDAERIRRLSIETKTLIFEVFAVGRMESAEKYDETFVKLACSALDSFNLSYRKPFSHYLRFLYSRRRLDPANKDDQFFHDAASFDELLEADPNVEKRVFRYDEWADNSATPVDGANDSVAEVIRRENETVEYEFARFLALIIAFLDHAPDKRDYTDDRKLYTKLFFTEAITRLVKTRDDEDECEPFERHEREIMTSMELPFQDSYMADLCRTILEIWRTDLKPEYGVVEPGNYAWRLGNPVFQHYLETAYNKTVSGAAITQQRGNFKRFAVKYGAKDRESLQ